MPNSNNKKQKNRPYQSSGDGRLFSMWSTTSDGSKPTYHAGDSGYLSAATDESFKTLGSGPMGSEETDNKAESPAETPGGKRESDDDNSDDNKTMAVFTWKYGGESVYLLCNEDGEEKRIPMRRNGKSFMLVRYIPKELYYYKYIVDGIEKCSPDMPIVNGPEGDMNVMDCYNGPIESILALEEQNICDRVYTQTMPDSAYMSQESLVIPDAMLYRAPDFSNGDRVGNDIHIMANHIYEDLKYRDIFGPKYSSYITIYCWEMKTTDISLARK
ncbi:SNF1-related protein kinase regulatory subunit beta-1 [Babesia sp. Xinjiang]|uniref:SNF1-related protein kinase regulatory subunit beta-1 n=1 Tax=Babesia sp. Xinjiang TaxID=462227 RepID=UPI000A260AA9|nr:SNF1-related protein kinase regulatory subunit beta-1 [Babesia sp. Xinjiang]ORM39805.1 SNF1-related protein kinase regulatory subunit beta-1 [Babesia sp. Xinjiang]